MIGFAGGVPGIVGALSGILACIASSILICCAPKSNEEGPCKFFAAGVILLLAGVMQLIVAVVVLVYMVIALNEVNENSWCSDRYSDCSIDSDSSFCSSGICKRDQPEDVDSRCSSQSDKQLCEDMHGGAKAAVTGIVIVFFGIAAAFLLVAGVLNTIGGAYCLKAKVAMQQKQNVSATGAVAMPVAAPVQGHAV